ncbi:MAG: glycosyltransferase [Tissierellales bacterium]|nr:glycosyltransferase [Tissierellales bacterium]
MRKPKRVLFVLPELRQGGAERVVFNIVSKMDRDRFSPHIAWFHGDRFYPFDTIRDVPIFFVDKQPGLDFRAMQFLSDLIEREKIDLINPHHFMPLFYSFFGSKIGHRRKLVYTEHSVWEAERVVGFWKFITRLMLLGTNALVGVSPEITEYLKKKYRLRNNKTRTILNGVDTDYYKPGDRKGQLRFDLGYNASHILIGMVGNFRQIKNHQMLIKAFEKIVSFSPECRLLLIGQGFADDPENTEESIKKQIKESSLVDKVQLLGYRNDVQNILQILDIFCLTSLREGLPLSVVEAMATGLPVIGTDTDGIRVVIESGKDGLLVDINDESGLTDALILLLKDNDMRMEIGRAARKKAEKYYSLRMFADRYVELFKTLIP